MTSCTNTAAAALATVALLVGCTVTTADTGQYKRMLAEGSDARAQESISCNARDLLCARLVTMQGEACAQTANDSRLPAAERQKRHDCAIADARSLPGLMPDDALPADRDRAALLVFDTWRAARDGGDPAATPAAMQGAIAGLAAMPGGQPYAATLGAENAVFAVLTGSGGKASDCAALATAGSQLPSAAPGELAERVGMLRTNIKSAKAVRGCAS